MGKIIGSLFVIFFLVFLVSLTQAAPDKRFDPVNNTCRSFMFEYMRQGAQIFKNVCQSCHDGEYDNGLRPMVVLYPRSYSPGRWTRILTERYSPCAQDGSWDGLEPNEILKLNDYLYRGGYGTWEDYTALEFC